MSCSIILLLIKPSGRLEAESKPVNFLGYKANGRYPMQETKTEVLFSHLSTSWKEV